MTNLLWFFFPICFVAAMVLAAAREDDPKRILVRGVHTFLVLCLLVAGLCVVMWSIQRFQPSRRQFFAGAGVLIALIYGTSLLFEGKNAERLARMIAGALAGGEGHGRAPGEAGPKSDGPRSQV